MRLYLVIVSLQRDQPPNNRLNSHFLPCSHILDARVKTSAELGVHLTFMMPIGYLSKVANDGRKLRTLPSSALPTEGMGGGVGR